MAKKYKSNELAEILTSMADYARQCIINGEDVTEYFEDIVTTSLFHDSEGKIIGYDKDKKELSVSTDY